MRATKRSSLSDFQRLAPLFIKSFGWASLISFIIFWMGSLFTKAFTEYHRLGLQIENLDMRAKELQAQVIDLKELEKSVDDPLWIEWLLIDQLGMIPEEAVKVVHG